MNRSLRFLPPVLVVSFLLLSTSGAVDASPPLPSSLYGTVKLNGANVPDGTLVQALIHDKVIASSLAQTYQGGSVYSLDIPGDDTSSAAVEGGVDGDTISFRIGGIQASQTGAWRSGTNVNLDLTASSAAAPLPPQPSQTPLPPQPSQTPVPPQPSQTPVPPQPSQTPLPPQPSQTPVPPQPSRTPLPPQPSIQVSPTRVPPTPTRIAELTTQGSPARTSVPTLPPTVSVGSPTALSAIGSPKTSIIVNTTQETQPTATANALQPPGNAQTRVPTAERSPSVFAANTRPSLPKSESDASHETKSPSLWWIGILLIIIVFLVSGLWYALKKRRTAKG